MPDNEIALLDAKVLKRRVDAFRKVFLPNGKAGINEKIVLETLEVHAKTSAVYHGKHEVDILTVTGRRELLNFIKYYISYDKEARRELADSIEQTEDALREQEEI